MAQPEGSRLSMSEDARIPTTPSTLQRRFQQGQVFLDRNRRLGSERRVWKKSSSICNLG